jgi:hypothetical protein
VVGAGAGACAGASASAGGLVMAVMFVQRV